MDTWSFNEEGVLVRTTKDEAALQQQQARFGGAALSRIHDLHLLDEEKATDSSESAAGASSSSSKAVSVAAKCPPSPATLNRSKSLNCLAGRPNPSTPPVRKSGMRILRWFKKAFSKARSRV
ncbi:hypothetical protein KP509_28G035200 [Ceratopteris richardii]|nr:hypothetical protein KP509_28G035200 [Ceratopteris richardii]